MLLKVENLIHLIGDQDLIAGALRQLFWRKIVEIGHSPPWLHIEVEGAPGASEEVPEVVVVLDLVMIGTIQGRPQDNRSPGIFRLNRR